VERRAERFVAPDDTFVLRHDDSFVAPATAGAQGAAPTLPLNLDPGLRRDDTFAGPRRDDKGSTDA
jgi:hypothetical protein